VGYLGYAYSYLTCLYARHGRKSMAMKDEIRKIGEALKNLENR